MALAGFSTPDRQNMKIYQQVRRRSMKLSVVEIGKKAAPAVISFSKSNVSNVSSITFGKEDLQPPVEDLRSVDEGMDAMHPLFVSDGSSNNNNRKAPPLPATLGTSVVSEKKSRATSKQVQTKHSIKARHRHRNKLAMKQATVLIQRNKSLPATDPGKRTIVEIVDETNDRLQADISAKTAAQYVREGWIGMSPKKRGPLGQFVKSVWDALKGAYVTYLKLEQAACKKQSSIKDMSLLVNACINKGGFNKTRDDLTRKIKMETADQFIAGKANVVEQRRLMWTTAYNLEVWFNTWSDTLIELGFARRKYPSEEHTVEGSLYFYRDTLDRIGNLDETDGTLDDTTGQRGGRPPMAFFSVDVAGGGTAVNKSGYSATVICGSTAAGDPYPPHFQLKTLAKTEAGQRMSVEWFRHTKDVYGTWGFGRKTLRACTFGMNERAGMNAVELDKYLKNSILPLYPDIQDYPGKRVLLKLDSGPGRLNVEMLADLRLQGLYIVPGVPNTTAKTQETDQNYGLYKSIVRGNLRKLSQSRFDAKLTLHITDLPLIVFGGKCPKTGIELRDSFSEAFSMARNLDCWRKCGAVPLTKAPIHSGQIRYQVPVGAAATAAASDGLEDEEEGIAMLLELERMNEFYCAILDANGFDGDLLRMKAPTRNTFVAVTEPHSQARILAIQNAKTAGQMFHATAGRHLNSDEFFKARALTEREAKTKALVAKKKVLQGAMELEGKVTALLIEKGTPSEETGKAFTLAELKILLKWKGVKPTSSKKADLVHAIANNPSPPNAIAWSDEQEMELVALQAADIGIVDTALGVSTNQMARAVAQNLPNLDAATRELLLEKLGVVTGGLPRGFL
jgi:hypothetical protein